MFELLIVLFILGLVLAINMARNPNDNVPVTFAKVAGAEGPSTIGTITAANADGSGGTFAEYITITPDNTKALIFAQGAPVRWDQRVAADAQDLTGEIGFFKRLADGITEELLGIMSVSEGNATFATQLNAESTPRLRFSAAIRGGFGELLVIKVRGATAALDEDAASQRFLFDAMLMMNMSIDDQKALG